MLLDIGSSVDVLFLDAFFKLAMTGVDQTCGYPIVPEESPNKGRPHEEIRSIPFDERDPTKVFKIGTTLGAEQEAMLVRVLREYWDIFTWEPKDTPGVDPEVSVHRLYVDPHYKIVKQKKRTFSEEKGEAIREEVGKLLGVNAIRELLLPTWLANVVLVPKPNGTSRYKVVDFLDAFLGYYKIFMAEEDVEKIVFVTEYVIYCWKVMAFGLKNAGATYKKMVNEEFSTQIG
ncbi:hypothetical protein LIER_26254 [Lithospermum erythrorhizon]|uniref:Uncharacterized protein n=1 Tax=Lithospermum erythrorhizon TaxID=34254 RepID=A0AAV3R7Q3_LITER